MLFNSWPFVLLVLVTTVLYYQVARTEGRQIGLLIAASLVFYSYGQAVLLLLLIVSILINTVTSYQVGTSVTCGSRRAWAALGISINLLVLIAFKYAGLLSGLILPSAQEAGGVGAWVMQLPLPIGISFYTFQGISLVVDTYSGDFKHRNKESGFLRSLRDDFFFISFFPQLIAGPVLKAKQFLPQIGFKTWNSINKPSVFHCLVTGYFLKMVVADNLKDQTFWIQFPYYQFRSTADLVLMLIAYSAQIFADFAGYSLIAIGVAALFGYRLPRNFNFPYISLSIAEFWRRWHISLSMWLREYLYFPMGGNRDGRYRTYLNLMVVMFLGGLWHGAAWSFAIWGLWHGIGLATERAASSLLAGIRQPVMGHHATFVAGAIKLARWFFVFVFVSMGWLLFELTDINEAFGYLSSMINNLHKPVSLPLLVTCLILVMPVVIYHCLHLMASYTRGGLESSYGYLYGVMLFLTVFNAGSSEAFVYFQF